MIQAGTVTDGVYAGHEQKAEEWSFYFLFIYFEHPQEAGSNSPEAGIWGA